MNPRRLHKETISSILACSYALSLTIGFVVAEAAKAVAAVVAAADNDDSSVVENKQRFERAMEAFGGARHMATLDSNAIDMDMLVKKEAETFIL
jgi:microcystin degradation protein MlrC